MNESIDEQRMFVKNVRYLLLSVIGYSLDRLSSSPLRAYSESPTE